ncbi:MAG: hypothetical protein ABI912_08015 [Actinomycetota bacterium]
MPDVAIARYDANTGWLPPVCPKHGRPADRPVSRKFYTPTPWWVYPFILLSLLVAALIAAAIRKSDQIQMPGCAQCSTSARTRTQVRVGTGVVALIDLSAAVVWGSGGLFVLAIPLVLAWLLSLSSLLDALVQVSGSLDGPWLKLKGVHPAFIAALRPNPAWNAVPHPSALAAVYHVGAAVPYWQPPQAR